MRTLLTLPLLAALLLPGLASADVPSPPPAGKEHVSYFVRLDNVADFADFSFLVYDKPGDGKLRASLRFATDGPSELLLVRGGNWRSAGRFGKPRIWLLPKAAAEAWTLATNAEIARQREACRKHGEGCAHISRFTPKYPPPKGAIDCGVAIEVRSSVPKGTANKDRKVVDVFRIVEATATSCKVERVTKSALPGAGPGGRRGVSMALFGGGAVVAGLLLAAGLWLERRRS